MKITSKMDVIIEVHCIYLQSTRSKNVSDLLLVNRKVCVIICFLMSNIFRAFLI